MNAAMHQPTENMHWATGHNHPQLLTEKDSQASDKKF